MIAPGILAVGLPIAVGLIFRYAYGGDGNEGWSSVAGLLMVGTIGGMLVATYLNNAGGAWDNAKKFIESGGLKDDERQRHRQGHRNPRRGRRRRHRRRPVQGHRGPGAPRPREAPQHDHAGAGAAVYQLAGGPNSVNEPRRPGAIPAFVRATIEP